MESIYKLISICEEKKVLELSKIIERINTFTFKNDAESNSLFLGMIYASPRNRCFYGI